MDGFRQFHYTTEKKISFSYGEKQMNEKEMKQNETEGKIFSLNEMKRNVKQETRRRRGKKSGFDETTTSLNVNRMLIDIYRFLHSNTR